MYQNSPHAPLMSPLSVLSCGPFRVRPQRVCVKGVHSYQRGIPDICLLCSQPKERLVVFYLLFIRYTKREIYSLINNHLQQSSPPPIKLCITGNCAKGKMVYVMYERVLSHQRVTSVYKIKSSSQTCLKRACVWEKGPRAEHGHTSFKVLRDFLRLHVYTGGPSVNIHKQWKRWRPRRDVSGGEIHSWRHRRKRTHRSRHHYHTLRSKTRL